MASPDVLTYGLLRDLARDLKVKNDFILDLLGLGAVIKHRLALAVIKKPIIAVEDPKIENLTSLEEDIRRFRPPWITKNTLIGKEVTRLEGAEIGTNALLAGYLRGRGYQADVGVTLPSHRRCDILLNGDIIIEAKPHLKSGGKLGSLMQEVISHKDLPQYSILIVIYGDASQVLLNQLNNFLGVNFKTKAPVIYLGKLVEEEK
jgi:hypothetical protein